MSKSLLFHGMVGDSAAIVVAGESVTRTIDAVRVENVTGSAVTVTLWQVPSGGSRSDATIMVKDLSVSANSRVSLAPFLANQALAQNASVHAQASAASAINLMISGRSQ